jgi:hypothetical protein
MQRPKPRPTPAPEDNNDGPRHQPIEAPTRKPLDSSIADILREEAARDKEVRATEEARPPTSERQGQSPSDRAKETRERIAAMTGDAASTPAAVAAAATGAVPGANLRTMPNIDEINATLRARAQASDMSGLTEEEQQEVVHRRGFRRGFFLVLFLLAILIAPYFFADQIATQLPQTKGVMAEYVQTVDQLRVWLDEQVQVGRGMIDDLMNGSETAPDAAPSDS